MKTFLLTDSSELMAVRLISTSWAHLALPSPKTFDSYFLDIIYVEYMKNNFLADSKELMTVRLLLTVRLISASWAQKRLIPSF